MLTLFMRTQKWLPVCTVLKVLLSDKNAAFQKKQKQKKRMQTVVYFEESLVIIYYKGKQKTRRVSH